MNLFQLGGLAFSIIMIALTITAITQQRLRRTIGILWLAFWMAAAGAILRPNITRTVAEVLGIGRGADLVMYCGILAAAIGFFHFYQRFRKIEANITKLVRHLAIEEATKTEKSSDHVKKRKIIPGELEDNQ